MVQHRPIIDHAREAAFSYAETQIRVLEVADHESFVETAEFPRQRHSQRHASSGNHLHARAGFGFILSSQPLAGVDWERPISEFREAFESAAVMLQGAVLV
jgi:hypothetical protein